MNPFLLPGTREEVIAALSSAATPPHGDMGGSSGTPDAQTVWAEARQTPGVRQMLYVHVPFCISRCSFCGFYRQAATEEALESYTDLLIREMEREVSRGVFTAPIEVVYFGGGTPTALSARSLGRLIRFIYAHFNLTPDVEFTVEGRLYAFDDERVRACCEAGANRFSFGIQSFQTDLRRSLGRRQSREELLERLFRVREIAGGKTALVADLIYGLPGQTQEEWMEENIRTVAEASPLDGVDLYSLKLFPGLPLARRMEREGSGWSEEERIRRHAGASDWLAAHGWEQLSCTHWRRNGNERNRYNHWTKTGAEILPFGGGAGGFLGSWGFMQTADTEAYREAVEAGRKPLAQVMTRPPFLALKGRLADQLERSFLNPADFPETDFGALGENWTAAGLWTRGTDGVFRLTRMGEYFQPKLCSRLCGFILSGFGKAAR